MKFYGLKLAILFFIIGKYNVDSNIIEDSYRV